jgi:hypothetical protein
MRQRKFIAGLTAAAWPLATRARQVVPVVGFLHTAMQRLTDAHRLPRYLLYISCYISGTAYAQSSVSLDDLQGAVVHTQVFYQTEVLRNGQLGNGQHREDITVRIDSPGTLRVTFVGTWVSKTGQSLRSSAPIFSTHVIGKAHEVRGGHTVWTFQDGTLINLATRLAGGKKTEIAFSRSGTGELQCSIRAIYAREIGVAGWRWISPVSGEDLKIKSIKTTSSSCKVSGR